VRQKFLAFEVVQVIHLAPKRAVVDCHIAWEGRITGELASLLCAFVFCRDMLGQMLGVVPIQVLSIHWSSLPGILVSQVMALFSQMPPYVWVLFLVLLLLGWKKSPFRRSVASPQHYDPDDYDDGEPDDDEDDFDDER
jgi:hypothetical protein